MAFSSDGAELSSEWIVCSAERGGAALRRWYAMSDQSAVQSGQRVAQREWCSAHLSGV